MSFFHGYVVNLYISYELDTWSRDLKEDFTLGNGSFGVVRITKIKDPDKSGYSGYGIGFNTSSQFLWSDGSLGKDGADMSSSMHVDDKKKDNLVLGQCPAQGLDDTAIIIGECPAQGLDDTAIISY